MGFDLLKKVGSNNHKNFASAGVNVKVKCERLLVLLDMLKRLEIWQVEPKNHESYQNHENPPKTPLSSKTFCSLWNIPYSP